MSEGIDLYFGIGGIIAGIYCIYQAILMRNTGFPSTTLVVDKETAKKKCKDMGAFLSKVIMPTFVLGIVIIIYGAVLLVNLYVMECEMVVYATMGITMAALIAFAVLTGKAKKEYY